MTYAVHYTENVVEFILDQVPSKRAYDKIDHYRDIIADFPGVGTPYRPYYPAAQPPFPCRWIAVPDTPFTLYYLVEEGLEKATVFHVENQATNPK